MKQPYLPFLFLGRRVFGKNKTFKTMTFRGLSQQARDTSKSHAVKESTTVVSCPDAAIKRVKVCTFFFFFFKPVNPAERADKLRSLCQAKVLVPSAASSRRVESWAYTLPFLIIYISFFFFPGRSSELFIHLSKTTVQDWPDANWKQWEYFPFTLGLGLSSKWDQC